MSFNGLSISFHFVTNCLETQWLKSFLFGHNSQVGLVVLSGPSLLGLDGQGQPVWGFNCMARITLPVVFCQEARLGLFTCGRKVLQKGGGKVQCSSTFQVFTYITFVNDSFSRISCQAHIFQEWRKRLHLSMEERQGPFAKWNIQRDQGNYCCHFCE